MRSKIRYDLLLKSQQYAKRIKHPIQTHLYETAYNYLQEMRMDVLKQFNNICIHGSYPELIIPKLKVENSNIWIHSHLSNMETLQHKDIKILNPQTPFTSKIHQHKFDLIISCLEAHHYDMQKLMESYLQMLTPDGAIMGCCWGENTLKELKWAFLMAENQRSGGVSPKVLNFPSLGEIGHSLTSSKVKMPTIVVRDFHVEVESVVDILTLLQTFGQSGVLQGKRKGVYRDVLLAACAYYDSQFLASSQQQAENTTSKEEKNNNVYFSLEMGMFIGWKEHQSQPKPLSPQKVINNSFFEQLMKDDKDSKFFVIEEGKDEPKEIDLKQKKGNLFEEQDKDSKDKK